jgi:hypothetical protein
VASARQFKRVVRILKNLENQMVAERAWDPMPSYLIECLVYNVPTECFAFLTRAEQTRAVLAHIAEQTSQAGCERTWLEVNGVRRLFGPEQRWTRQDAYTFAIAAWPYVEEV